MIGRHTCDTSDRVRSGGYADPMTRSSPLISAQELLALVRSGAPNVRIVDVRWYLDRPGDGVATYAAGHLPGAIHLDLDDDLADLAGYGAPGRHPLPEPDVFEAELAAAGIGDDDLVVAYDDVGGWGAARLWWMLDVLGHERVAVLDGGIAAWTAAGGELTTEVRTLPPAELHLADEWSRGSGRGERPRREGPRGWGAGGPGRGRGGVALPAGGGAPRLGGGAEPVDPIAGHIPTAR